MFLSVCGTLRIMICHQSNECLFQGVYNPLVNWAMNFKANTILIRDDSLNMALTNEYQQFMFSANIKDNIVNPCKPSLCYIKGLNCTRVFNDCKLVFSKAVSGFFALFSFTFY